MSVSIIRLSVNRDFIMSVDPFSQKKFYFSGRRCLGEITTVLIEMIVAVYRELDYIKRNKLDIEEHGWRFDGQIEMFAHALTGIPYPPME